MISSRMVLTAALVVAAVACGAVVSRVGDCIGGPASQVVPSESLASIVLGQEDIPGKVVLSALKFGSDEGWCYPQCAKTTARMEERWGGELVMKGDRRVSGCTVIVSFAVLDSAVAAVECARREVRSSAVAAREITGQASVASFSDRAWGGASSLVFTRANAVCLVFMSRPPKENPNAVCEMGAALSRRIDHVLAGRPEPVAVLPLSADELHVGLPEAWKLAHIGQTLWGADAITIALTDGHGIPRSIPAKKLPGGDYVVPLRHLAAVLRPDGELKISEDKREATLDIGQGKVRFKKGESRAEGRDKVFDLGRPVESAHGEFLVPLSVAEKLTGKRLVWEKRDTLPVGRLEAVQPKP